MRTHKASICFAVGLMMVTIGGCSKENPRVITKMNTAAALPGDLPWNPLQGRVITAWVDAPNSTMSTLYGNDIAVGHARSTVQQPYPAGTVLSLVTWKQQEDPRWFGANIPAAPESVEFVTVEGLPNGSLKYSYRKYQGSPLHPTSVEGGPAPNGRASFLMSQRAAVMP